MSGARGQLWQKVWLEEAHLRRICVVGGESRTPVRTPLKSRTVNGGRERRALGRVLRVRCARDAGPTGRRATECSPLGKRQYYASSSGSGRQSCRCSAGGPDGEFDRKLPRGGY